MTKADLPLEGVEDKYNIEFEGVAIYKNSYNVTEAFTYIGLFYMLMGFISIMDFSFGMFSLILL